MAGHSERELRRAFVAQFPDLFPAEYNASLQQAMFLSNSPLFDQLLKPRGKPRGSLLASLQRSNPASARPSPPSSGANRTATSCANARPISRLVRRRRA